MVKVQFSEEMLHMLMELKGKMLISFECENDERFSRSYGNLRINLSEYAIELTNEENERPFFDQTEEITGFSCKRVEPSTKFQLMVNTETKVVPVEETIKSVEIVTDVISVNHGVYEIVFDEALIIQTESKTIMFSRDTWFSEVITISEHGDYDSVYPISSVMEDWNDFGEAEVEVFRSRKTL